MELSHDYVISHHAQFYDVYNFGLLMPQVNFLSTQVIWMQLAPLQAVINGNIFAVSISCCVTNQSSAVSFSQAERRAELSVVL